MGYLLTAFFLCKETAEVFISKLFLCNGDCISPGFENQKSLIYNEGNLGCSLSIVINCNDDFNKTLDRICDILHENNMSIFGLVLRDLYTQAQVVVDCNIKRSVVSENKND